MSNLDNQAKLKINQNTGQIEPEGEEGSIIFEENGTFCRVGSAEGGVIEIDLRSVKQKGTEERFISVKTNGYNEENEVVSSEVFLLNEDQFVKLKAFITKLNWND